MTVTTTMKHTLLLLSISMFRRTFQAEIDMFVEQEKRDASQKP